jgi:EmrB/QacA subfamily drug resistance transporter
VKVDGVQSNSPPASAQRSGAGGGGGAGVLPVLFVGVLMGALDIAIAGPALPAMQASYRVDDRAIPWVFTIYVLFNLIGAPLMAKLSDLFGRRAVYVADVSLFAVGSLLVVFAPNFGVVLAGRAIQGLGAGGIFPVAGAVIGDTFPPEKRGSALGLIGAVFGLAFVIGPIIGGVLLAFSWHWLFLINLPLAAGLIIAALRVLPTGRRAARKPLDGAGMAALALLLATVTYGVNSVDAAHLAASLTSLPMLALAVAALALLGLFIAVERRAADPVIRLSLFASRQVSLALLFAAGAGLGEAAIVFVPKLLKSAFHVTESQASFMLLPLVLAMAIGSPLAGRALDRVGSRLVLLAGNALLAAGMGVWAFFATNLALFYAGSVLAGLALGVLLGAPLRYIMLGEAGPGERAAAQGALALFTGAGQLVGGALVGAVIASHGGAPAGYESAYLLGGALAAALTLLALRLKRRPEERGQVMAAQPAG